MKNPEKIPQHVAIIMDGNGRWAKMRGLPKLAGHRQGVRVAEDVIEVAAQLGIKVLTLYTFSSENWKRPRIEIDALFGLLNEHLDKEEGRLNKNNIRMRVIGRLEGLPSSIQEKLKNIMESTRSNTGLILNLALNYGGRSEIVDAVRKIGRDVADGLLKTDDIDEDTIARYLYTSGLPDPDLLIRTSGECRVSNFLIWQISYAEIYVTQKLWPDFTKEDLEAACQEFARRERRFGG